MSPDTLLSLTGMMFALAWTPGPNNSMLASSGATYGLRASLPHVMGITLGFPVMIFLVGLGLGGIFGESETLKTLVRIGGAAMLLWIAWRIATASAPGAGGQTSRPLNLLEAALFQWVNPKGWVAAIAITAQFINPVASLKSALIIALVAAAASVTSTTAWVIFGRVIARWLQTPLRLRVFNLTMAGLLVGFLLVALLEG